MHIQEGNQVHPAEPANGAGQGRPAFAKPGAGGANQKKMEEDIKGFKLLFGAVQAMGILLVVLVAVWTSHFLDGFAWRSNPGLEFNWHPLLMTFGFIYLYGNTILVYRALRHLRKQKLKIIHAIIHTVVVLCVIIALVAVFDSHNLRKDPIPNLYSLHSWIGIITVVLYVGQWFGSILLFLFPGGPLPIRAAAMPYHVFFGLAMFVMVCAAAVTGLTEKAIFSIKNYDEIPGHGVIVNVIGLVIIVFAGLVVHTATYPKFKRYPRPEDGALLTPSSLE